MAKESSVNKSNASDKQHKGKSRKDQNPKDKQGPYKNNSGQKSPNMSSKRDPSPTLSHSLKSKRSRSSSIDRDAPSSKTKSTQNVHTTKISDDYLVGPKVVKRHVVSQGSTEVDSKDNNTPTEALSALASGSPSEPTKDSKEQSYWKDFPAPKFYKDLKKFYDPIPKPGELPPSMYFPYDGPKLRRYKNYRPYKDPLSKYNDEEYFGNELKELIFQDLQNFKRKLELIQLDVDMATLRAHTVK